MSSEGTQTASAVLPFVFFNVYDVFEPRYPTTSSFMQAKLKVTPDCTMVNVMSLGLVAVLVPVNVILQPFEGGF